MSTFMPVRHPDPDIRPDCLRMETKVGYLRFHSRSLLSQPVSGHGDVPVHTRRMCFIRHGQQRGMSEHDPDAQLAIELIRTRIQIAISHSTSGGEKALVDVLLGMNNVLEFLASPGSARHGMGWEDKKRFADRIGFVIDGMKRYAKFQMERLETFASVVEVLSVDVAPERDDIRVVREKVAAEVSEMDGAVAALKSKSISDGQLLEIAQRLRDQTNTLPDRTRSVLDIDRRLREKADHVIMASLDKNDLVHKIAMVVGLPARDDPGASEPI